MNLKIFSNFSEKRRVYIRCFAGKGYRPNILNYATVWNNDWFARMDGRDVPMYNIIVVRGNQVGPY